MKENANEIIESTEVIQLEEIEEYPLTQKTKTGAFDELEHGIYAALETYSNVHRGSGHFSMATTHLYELARKIVLDYLDLDKSKYIVIFCTVRGAEIFTKKLKPNTYQIVSSLEIGLSLGVRAVALQRNALPNGVPFLTGGGTTRLISKSWIVWASSTDRFEAGTPAIINIIAFAKALLMVLKFGKDCFLNQNIEKLTADKILYHDEFDSFSGRELMDKLKQTLIGKGVHVPTVQGLIPFTNFDNSASTPTFAPIWKAFYQSLYQTGQAKLNIVQEVKSICANAMGAPLTNYDVIFTSNTTESINLAAESFSHGYETDIEPIIINSILEHSSNDLPWRMINGSSLIHLMVDNDGFVNIDELKSLLVAYNQKTQFGKKRIKLVAISGASNVLGTCNKIAEISQVVHRYGAHLLVDAAQLAAHRKIDMEKTGIEYLAFSAHKVYAPFGCGVLIVKKGLLNFNHHEMSIVQASGEENIGGIAALGKSLTLLQRIGMDLIKEEEQTLTRQALLGLSKISGIKIFGIKETEPTALENKVGVISFIFNKMMANKVAKELAVQSGIGVRSGCHCAHIIVKHVLKIPPFLEQFQRLIVTLFPKLKLPGIVRVSFGIENTEEDVDKLIYVLSKIAKQEKSPANNNLGLKDIEKSTISQAEVHQQMDEFIIAVTHKVYYQ